MAPDPLIGTDVGMYRVESVIGRGGMSVVYLAYDPRLGRRIALKILAPELAEEDAFRTRFARESQLAAGLEHPSIVPVYEAGELDGLLFIAMRHIEGTDLRGLLIREGPLHPERALRLLRPIAAALDVAHRRGLVHRDVKPANILVSSDESGSEHPYLSDFGLTKHTSSKSGLTKTGTFMGTVDYVAPEQIQGGEIDGRTDEYSLACVLFETLTGEAPFERENDLARLFGHLQDEPPSATSRLPQLPNAIDDVLAHGMAKSREDRYDNCSAFLEAASSAFQQRPESASLKQPLPATVRAAPPPPPPVEGPIGPTTPETAPTPTSPPPTRSRKALAAAAIGVVVAIAAIVIGTQVLGGAGDRGKPAGVSAGPQDVASSSPSAQPSPVSTVFSDDFSDPSSGWGQTRPAVEFRGDYVDGRYQISASSTQGGTGYQQLKGHGTVGDVAIVVEAQPLSHTSGTFYGVTCRGSPTIPRAYVFLISTEGDYAIGIYDFSTNRSYRELVAGRSDAIHQGKELNTIAATCAQQGAGVELRLEVNGQFVDSVLHQNDPLPAGRVGLSLDSIHAAAVAFDNFQATRL